MKCHVQDTIGCPHSACDISLVQQTTDTGHRTTDNGQRTTDNGQRTTDNGQRTTDKDKGQNTAALKGASSGAAWAVHWSHCKDVAQTSQVRVDGIFLTVSTGSCALEGLDAAGFCTGGRAQQCLLDPTLHRELLDLSESHDFKVASGNWIIRTPAICYGCLK